MAQGDQGIYNLYYITSTGAHDRLRTVRGAMYDTIVASLDDVDRTWATACAVCVVAQNYSDVLHCADDCTLLAFCNDCDNCHHCVNIIRCADIKHSYHVMGCD